MAKKTYRYQESTDLENMQAADNAQPKPKSSPPEQLEAKDDENKKTKKNQKLKILIPVITLFFVILIMGIMLSSRNSSGSKIEQDDKQSQIKESTSSASNYQKLIEKVENLETKLNQAELIDLDLQFPQVDWRLRIEE